MCVVGRGLDATSSTACQTHWAQWACCIPFKSTVCRFMAPTLGRSMHSHAPDCSVLPASPVRAIAESGGLHAPRALCPEGF